MIGNAGLVAGQHDHGPAADDAIHRPQHRRDGGESLGGICTERPVDDGGHSLWRIRPEQMNRRYARRLG